MTDLTTLVLDSVGDLSGQVYLFGALSIPPLPAQAHHLLQMQVNFEQACDLMVLEDVQINSPVKIYIFNDGKGEMMREGGREGWFIADESILSCFRLRGFHLRANL